tara:strand:+ start:20800 stop:21366 length:567 start_codon:yes stop_codon:yes gene_type:complete
MFTGHNLNDMDHSKLTSLYKTIPIVVLIGLFALLAGTSPPMENHPFTGHYYVHGSKIISTGGWLGSDYTVIDTVYFASVVTVKYMEDMTDTLHFFGLPGADEGERRIYSGRHNNSYIGGIVSYNDSDYNRVYGSLSNEIFEINYTRPSGRFIANGNISYNTIELQGEFLYRGNKAEYELVGEKIEYMQ